MGKSALSQQLQHSQKLVLSQHMQQALKILQLPVLELKAFIIEQVESNPLLDYSSPLEESNDSFKMLSSYAQGMLQEESLATLVEHSLADQKSLSECLLEQAALLLNKEELSLAEIIIGHLDEKGLLSNSLEEIMLFFPCDRACLEKVLTILQTFDPPGVCACSLQESLLLQLQRKKSYSFLAFKIVQDHFDLLLKNKIPLISKKVHRSIEEVKQCIEHDIASLSFNPAADFTYLNPSTIEIFPDASICFDQERIHVKINDEYLPSLKMNSTYLGLLKDKTLPKETKSFLTEKLQAGKWLFKSLHQREQTLHKITEKLALHQKDFFEQEKGSLKPLTMKQLAQELSLHESTIARAVSNKYLASPRGLFRLRDFFTYGYIDDAGEDVSAQTIKKLIEEIIHQEDKTAPLSDESIAQKINSKGVTCARRTITKYRKEIGIGTALQRKQFN